MTDTLSLCIASLDATAPAPEQTDRPPRAAHGFRWSCPGSATGAAPVTPDAVSGTFSGAPLESSAVCCGEASRPFPWRGRR